MRLPEQLEWIRSLPAGAQWLDGLADAVAACADRWSLTLQDPYPGSNVSLVIPAETAAGDQVVIKLQYPDRESEHEADALEAWAGRGAIRLLDHDRDRRALLVERCVPGTHLSASDPADALGVLIELLPELWIPAPASTVTLDDEAHRWIDSVPKEWEKAGRPFARRLIDAGIDVLRSLTSTQGPAVLLHQDLHADNVLSAQRRPWLAIDPKPLAGEREFSAAPIVRSSELGATRSAVDYRLDRLTDELGLDRERARGWVLGQTLAWGFEGGTALGWHVAVAGWMV